ncbi:MAG: ABC transporter ATP-binding protein [Anaerolineae bacterium]|nr:ABC transporter ATP-binding protein [Anaerolineae bacterium]
MNIPVQRYWDLLKKYLRPQWRSVLILAFLLLVTIGLRVINPQIIRGFIDSATNGQPLQQLTFAAITFIISAIIIQLFSVLSTYLGENIGWRATNALRADMATHALKLDMSFHNDHTPGEMIERLDGDVIDLAIFFSQFAIRILANLLLLGGILVALYLEDWRIGLALTAYSGLSLWSLNRMRSVAVPHWKANREADAEVFGYLEEQLSGTEDIRSSGGVAYAMRNLFRVDRERLLKRRKAGLYETFLIQLWVLLYELGRVIAFIGGFYLFTQDLITLGTAYLIINYTDAIFRPLREITNEIQNLQKAGGSIERIQDFYNIPNKVQDTGTRTLPAGALPVEFDHVTFSYNDEDKILRDLSFSLKPGQVLGLLGRTGSGKTTITRLLFRLYDINNGAIKLADGELRDYKLSELQRRIGMVTQDVQLFRATVRDNLTFFDKSVSDARIMEVLEELGLLDWFSGLPNGLDTELESGGKGLSAGEGQLLAFTRVFLKDPGLVILDEASSRLDPLTEQRIERAVDRLLRDRTGIIVAHRLATVQRADLIMVLEQGAIREYGERITLMNDPDSRFSHLLRAGEGESAAAEVLA